MLGTQKPTQPHFLLLNVVEQKNADQSIAGWIFWKFETNCELRISEHQQTFKNISWGGVNLDQTLLTQSLAALSHLYKLCKLITSTDSEFTEDGKKNYLS